MIRALPHSDSVADDARVGLRERWSNIVRIYFTPLTKWPKSDRYVAVGWRPGPGWTQTAAGEWSRKIEKGNGEK